MNVENIIEVWNRATPSDHTNAGWYQSAHTFALGLSERYNVPVQTAAAVIALLSPRCEWALNMKYADQYLREGICPTFYSTLAKLGRVVNDGETLDSVMSRDYGWKVRNFYLNILDPSDAEAVTIDRHAADIADGKVGDDASRKGIARRKGYDEAADLYREAARQLDVLPNVLQAVTWVAWKRTKEYKLAIHARFNLDGAMN